MTFEHNRDPFMDKQPPMDFLEELNRPMHTCLPARWNEKNAEDNEVYITCAVLEKLFPDEEGILDTAYEDFEIFLKLAGAAQSTVVESFGEKSSGYPIRTVLDAKMRQEAYVIKVSYRECVIASADTEGIRRALYYIEDEMYRRMGSLLPLGVIYRYAVIKTRISRGFTNPHYGLDVDGELSDDTEYYSDNYLNRLAHDGVNSLWVQEHFRVLLPSRIFPEYGQQGAVRLARLNRLIERSKRYGIKVYLEGVEPASTYDNPALENYPEVHGQEFEPYHAFCSSTEIGRAYIKESFSKLFELAPGLAGMVNISLGESVGCCAAVEDDVFTCPHCRALGLNRAQVLANCERDIVDAMRSVKPEAELVSWAYALRGWNEEERGEYFRLRDPRVSSLINFEDHGKVMQLGRERTAMDYWLSYTGPGKLFTEAAQVGKERNAPVYAKIQVCSSHEVSTVPYVPVPGILYDKYKYMHENGVTGVMYCWYFGNYPCMMNKAAGELAFAPFPESKEAFLRSIAGIYWGSENENVARAYQYFEEGYSNYPVSMTFEWHGPMGDGPVWPLHLEPVDLPVSKAYTTENMPGGDRIGEALLMGHTHEEAMLLVERMSGSWKKGVDILSLLPNYDDYDKKDQQSVASALDILFRSGLNILRFYDLRNQLGLKKAGGEDLLSKMREIVLEEIDNSSKLEQLCREDRRLGYHSEAIAFKYFPEKLRWRISCLEKLLEEEFTVVAKRIHAGKAPIPYFLGMAAQSHRYVTEADIVEEAVWEDFMLPDGTADIGTKIRISESETSYCVQIWSDSLDAVIIQPEFRIFHPYAPIRLVPGERPKFENKFGLFDGRIQEELSKWEITEAFNVVEHQNEVIENSGHVWSIRLNKRDFFAGESVPFRLSIKKRCSPETEWERGKTYYQRGILGIFSPDSYVFVIPRAYKDVE